MLIALSLDHWRASVAGRESFALPEEERARLAALVRRSCGGQVAFLVTCNRTEVFTWVTASHPAEAIARVSDLARRLSPGLADRFLSRATVYIDQQAVRHLFRVAAGLESQLPGDTQVLGQVRSAYGFAVDAGAVGAELHRLFQSALRAGKRVHSETEIGRRETTLGGVAALSLVDGSAARRLVIIGAGQTAECAALAAVPSGAELTIINRNRERAEVLARRVGASTASFEARHPTLAVVDAAIVTTAALAPVVRAADLRAARMAAGASQRPLQLVDLAVPRNVEPDIAALPGVHLRTLEHFGRPDAPGSCPAAEGIVEEEVRLLTAWLRYRPRRGREVA